MPRDRRAEKAEEKKREELERKREQERDRQREEERHQQALELEREFERQEERKRQQAEAARVRAAEQHRQERHAQLRTERRRQQHEAERVDARQKEQRRAAVEQGRAEERQGERDRERSEARKRDEARQAESQARTDERRAEQRQADAGERRREDQQRAREEQRSEERRKEQQAQRQTEARAVQQSEERQAESQAARGSEEHAAQRSEERAAQRSEERKAENQAGQRAEERAAQRSEERKAETQAAQQSEERAAQRSEERQAETRAAQRSEERAAQKSEERAAQQAQERADGRRSEAAGERRREQQAEDRRQQQMTDERRQGQAAENRAARKQEQAGADKARAESAERRRQQQADDRDARKQEQIQADQAKARAERGAPTERKLRARLPSGHLSNGLPWLITSGNRIVSAEDGSTPPRAAVLRGVNRSGLEYSEPRLDFLRSAGITQGDVAEMAGWGVNIVRVPFNQDWALHGRHDHPATEYLDNLDQLIFWLSSRGAYTLLNLQWLDADTAYGTNPDGTVNRVAPLPNPDSITVWTLLARRYQNEPAVLYDIFNEPHAPLADDHNPLASIREDGTTVPVTTVTMAEWQPWARQLIRAIRGVHTNALIFVSGVDWAYDLRGMPLTIVAGGREVFADLVYSTHVYPWKGPKVPSGTAPADIPTLAGTATVPNWADAFGRLAAIVPVFAGEWGGRDADATPWGNGLGMYMSALRIGWTAWSWVDWPPLRQPSPTGVRVPTPFGNVVRHWLAMP